MASVVFIVQQLSQPRCIKRIQTLLNAGIDIKVYGFDNGLYNDSLKSLPFSIERIITRKKEAGKLSKIKLFTNTVRHILHENKNADLFYVFGYELGACVLFFGCKNYIYEEADVSAARVSNRIIRNSMLRLDRSIIRNSYRTVLTSEGFIPCIFRKDPPKGKIILLPNKLNTYFDEEKKKEISVKSIDINHIKFAFIGLIRYPNTIIRFARVIGRYFPQHEFHFWGEPERVDYIDEEIKNFKNVYLHGQFKNPEGLQGIYAQTDISVVCYDTKSGNVLIAEPNKIYESLFFETPLVVSSGTFLAKRVKQFDVGYDIDASSDEEIKRFINNLDVENIRKKHESLKSIPWEDTIDDATMLLNAINNYH